MPASRVPDRRRSAGARLLQALGGLFQQNRSSEEVSALTFSVRMFLSAALTFATIGTVGYLVLEKNLARQQVKEYAAAQRADVTGFEHTGAHVKSTADEMRAIDSVIDAVAQRPGTRLAVLVNQQGVVTATGDERLLGTKESGTQIDAALKHGKTYEGRETDPGKDSRDFAFVFPVTLPTGRYAYDVTFDHHTYDAQLHEIRVVLALLALLGLVGGGLVFYVVGGRRLMRDHRMTLRRATRDGLTDLPNQRAFQDEFPDAVAAATRYGDPLALVLLDVDDFKLINDRHGHQQGDTILRVVSGVLRSSRPGDRPYRIGGDEFALILAHTDTEGAHTVARRLSRNFAEAGVEISMGSSVLRPGVTAETLRAEADTALYEAKRQGANRAAHFDEIQMQVVVTTAETKEAVRRLIEEARLTTVFQPIWNFDAEALLGIEALTRPDSSYGLSGPAEAFDVAEHLGRVHQLDVLCAQSALRSAPELPPGVLLFLNLAPMTLDLDAEGEDWLQLAVEDAGLQPQQVVVEVTERFGGRTAAVVKCLQRLRLQGFKIAVDDVGTGNSGLEMLRQLDAEFVKIDRSIVAAAATEPGARAVLMAIATFARQTGAFVIAEGIEDEDTLQFLRSIDERELSAEMIIQGGQGFQLGRPAPDMSHLVRDALAHAGSRG